MNAINASDLETQGIKVIIMALIDTQEVRGQTTFYCDGH